MVFFSTDESSVSVRQPWYVPNATNNEINQNARRAFETVLFVRQRLYSGERFRRFVAGVVDFARELNRTKQLTHGTVSFEAKKKFLRKYQHEENQLDISVNCLSSSVEFFDQSK